MRISLWRPTERLQGYIDCFWWVRSDHGLPLNDSRIIVPNGKIKIVIPYKNSLQSTLGQKIISCREQCISVIGAWDRPTVITAPPFSTEALGIELSLKGAYRFFPSLNMSELTNTIYTFEDLFGSWGRNVQQIMANVEVVSEKIKYIEDCLIKLLEPRLVYSFRLDRTIEAMMTSNGLIPIKELEEVAGYSRRYLDQLFQRHVGLAPKTVAGIIKFQKLYRIWVHEKTYNAMRRQFPTYYYDQSHFIHGFKKYTGHAPQDYAKMSNEFGRSFYNRC